MACATYLVDKVKQQTYDAYGAEYPFDEADQVFSLGCFGLDILWNPDFQLQAENVFPSNPPFVSDSLLLNLPALNRGGVSPQDARNQAEQDRQRRHTLLASQDLGDALRITTGAQAGYTGSCSGPSVEYCALLMGEALAYLDRLTYGPTRFGPTATTRLPEPLVYALYHTGGDAPGFLASAAAYALLPSSSSNSAKALRTALHTQGITTAQRDVLTHVRTRPDAPSKQTARDAWPSLAPLLGSDTVAPALATYLASEGDSVWRSYLVKAPPGSNQSYEAESVRTNCIGYAQLYKYLAAEVGAP